MKERLRTDGIILGALIAVTFLLLMAFPNFYFRSRILDLGLDLIGLLGILFGIFLRMAGRGHKKTHSQESKGLVMSGPYKYMRNPMYLGTFLVGCGFALMAWPVWLLPVFIWLFYSRFRWQIEREELWLGERFKEVYAAYCRQVPRLFPDLRKLKIQAVRQDFPWEELWLTQEKIGRPGCMAAAFLLEFIKGKSVYGSFDVLPTAVVILLAVVIFQSAMVLFYRHNFL